MVDQLRIYVIRDEAWNAWVGFFNQVIRPLHAESGIPVVAAWREALPPTIHLAGGEVEVPQGCSRFIWIRRFADDAPIAEQERAYATSPARIAAGNDIPRQAFVSGSVSLIEAVEQPPA